MNPIDNILLHNDEFTQSEIKIKNIILTNPDIIACFPLVTAAYKMNVSKSALLRFCQKCGYKGFSEFKYELSRYLHSGNLSNEKIINDSSQEIINLFIEKLTLLKESNLDNQLEALSEDILKSNKIKIYGVHETGLAARHLQYRLTTIGIDSESITDSSLIAEKALFSSQNDLNIYFSLSALTSIIVESIKNSISNNSNIALITQNNKTKFSKQIPNIIVLPSFSLAKDSFFIDSQALNFVFIELLINKLSKLL
ncbi:MULTISPECIES: MurR/RpiR family transcriptional regulator [Clostridium]|uniref:MurR/RpiR family transcriptional regulator n=1 Tax=Clostridium TaxID=1485 RepID=UPI000C07899E|nr:MULTISPECIES: MurR/RpiR family transcriptional regulator [Clostridium]MDU1278455.1 MurR/RpiR family transcriptional regulator [Clostridium sp.]MDU3549142.1 MurR/RpiR family transcriptional regulator [Clostridium sp.]MDU4739713.1 MurR/RpiR family transcriptional regulator [Clostridium sp.]MDU7004923.1 MurR/RpiR family transcriptional regulator [Clostridium sp.]MDU7088757.1 MurR/RpiR family transcriptional regulator [Clostridium sp.]